MHFPGDTSMSVLKYSTISHYSSPIDTHTHKHTHTHTHTNRSYKYFLKLKGNTFKHQCSKHDTKHPSTHNFLQKTPLLTFKHTHTQTNICSICTFQAYTSQTVCQ